MVNNEEVLNKFTVADIDTHLVNSNYYTSTVYIHKNRHSGYEKPTCIRNAPCQLLLMLFIDKRENEHFILSLFHEGIVTLYHYCTILYYYLKKSCMYMCKDVCIYIQLSRRGEKRS